MSMTSDFRQARFVTSAANLGGLPPDQGREVAFAGRSNAGKSSALNAITGVKGLARVSKTPGRTQLINLFALDDTHRLVDLPGYGYARVPEPVRRQWGELMTDYFSHRRALAGLVLVMDIRHPLTDFDRQLLGWCRPLNLPVLALLTKADKLSLHQALQASRRVAEQLAELATVQLFSALTPMGVDPARDWLAGLFNTT